MVAGVISSATSRAIYEDALRAYSDQEHPCHGFRELQHGVPDESWQLPEPFNGASARAGIVFLGLNPSYSAAEAVPRLGTSFNDWDHFYRHRLDGDPSKWPLLYRRYQTVGQIAVGDQFLLGRDALVLEIVRFRSEKHEGMTSVVLEHELRITAQLLAEVAPAVIVSVGSDALWELRRLFPQLKLDLPENYGMLDVEGNTFQVDSTSAGSSLRIVASSHLTGAFGMTHARVAAIGQAVGHALGSW